MAIASVEAIDLAGEIPAASIDQLLLGPAQRQHHLIGIGRWLGRVELGHARFACVLRLPGALLLAGGSSLRLKLALPASTAPASPSALHGQCHPDRHQAGKPAAKARPEAAPQGCQPDHDADEG